MLIFFHVKQPCLDQTQKRCVSEIPFQNPFESENQLNAGVLSQSASSNHALLITKSALVIKKNALFLRQSAFSNFAPHMINKVMDFKATATCWIANRKRTKFTDPDKV